MSKLSRISLTPLLALTLGTACDTDQDDQFEDSFTEEDSDALRSGRSSGGRYGSGNVLNTNNGGGHFFDQIALSGMHGGLELQGVMSGGFHHGGGRPGWEIDDVPFGEYIDDPSGVFDLSVDSNHLLTGTTTTGMVLEHGDFHNSIWTFQFDPSLIPMLNANNVQHDGSGVIEMRLEVSWIHPDGLAPIPPGVSEDSDEAWVAQQGSVPVYTFYYQQHYQDIATCTASPGQTYTSAVLYNNVGVDSSSGDVTVDDGVLYVGCLEGAVGKAGGLWGYWPDQVDNESLLSDGDERDNFDTATRAVRADYCGDGNPYTSVGKELDLYDMLPTTGYVNTANDIYSDRPMVEAVWGPGGALCLDVRRDYGAVGPVHCSASLPVCGGQSGGFTELNSSPYATMLTRTWDHMEPNP